MSHFTKTKSGIIVPATQSVPVRCDYCPSLIFKDKEAEGRLHLLEGRVACAKCRILRSSKYAKQILADKEEREKDLTEKERLAQAEADQEIRVIAHGSQIATKTAISPK